jgi:poly(beta-D-mannuronate) lyase
MKRISIAASIAFCAVVGASYSAAQRPTLHSPWSGTPVRMTSAPYHCPQAVHLSPDLATEGFYADSIGSVIDPVKMKAYAESSGPYKDLGNVAVAAADAFRTTGSKEAAACVRQLLNAAATDRVFTGKMSSTQAYFVQGWVIGALAISYLKVRDSGVIPTDEAKKIVAWMKEVAKQTLDFYEGRTAFTGTWQKNNHRYWAGVEIASIGIAANDRAMLEWAVAAYREGIDQITPEGTMSEEMRRGQRALHYHLYASSPLVYIAECGEDNGIHLYAERNHALQRLVTRSTTGLVDNKYFEQQSGVKQDAPNGPPTAEEIGWAAAYVKRFPDPTISSLIKQAPSLSYMYLGGLPPN